MFNFKREIANSNSITRLFCISVVAITLFLIGCGGSDNDSRDANNSFRRQSVDVSGFMVDENLRFDAVNNPAGLFTSDDNDDSSLSDAVARLQLIQLGEAGEPSNVSYLEAGDTKGDPMILIHGQPTQAFLWRNVIPLLPLLPQDAHIIAIDMIGYGESSKHNIDYTFKQHSAYLHAFIETLGLADKPITFLVHDIGSIPALAYASRFPENI